MQHKMVMLAGLQRLQEMVMVAKDSNDGRPTVAAEGADHGRPPEVVEVGIGGSRW